MSVFSIPEGARDKLKPILRDALKESRNSTTLEIDREEAAKLAVGMLFERMRADIGSLMYKSIEYMVGYEINNLITKSKQKALENYVKNQDESDEEIADKCYSEIISYRVKGRAKAITKFLGDATLDEVQTVVSQHKKRWIVLGRKRDRYQEVARRMKSKGAIPSDIVADYFPKAI